LNGIGVSSPQAGREVADDESQSLELNAPGLEEPFLIDRAIEFCEQVA
jgi:hypothetical protein